MGSLLSLHAPSLHKPACCSCYQCICLYIHVDEDSATKSNCDSIESLPYELHRKLVAEAFWTAECEAELRESNNVDYHFKHVEDREELMDAIDKERAKTNYAHVNCSEECKKRGKR